MARKESTIVYDRHVDICEQYLTDEQFGKLMFALVKGKEPDFSDDPILAMAYAFIALQKDLDDKKYEEKCKRNRENGKKGGAPKGNQNARKQPKQANGFLNNPNDNENENDNDKDNDKEKYDGNDIRLSSPPRDHFGSFNNVALSDMEHAALKQQYENTADLIDKVSVWLRSAKNPVEDHYALCVKFANNDNWPKRRKIEPVEEIVVTDPPDEETRQEMVREMRQKLGAVVGGKS